MDANIEAFSEQKVYEGIFNIFELELEEISRYVAFTDSNMSVYSNKIHEVHLRVCSEIENILKIVTHRHFVTEEDIQKVWEDGKSNFLKKKKLTSEYEELKNELNKSEKGKLDKNLFGFPDFAFYFKLACEKFNLDKKVIKFSATVTHSVDWQVIQPFELRNNQNVPSWWTNYNKLKHDKISNFNLCKLGDLIYSMSGLFILMNYILKYQDNNLPIPNKNFALDKLKGMRVSLDCEFCSFQSKLFTASNAYQIYAFSMFLPTQISENDFQNLKVIDLELRMNFKIKNIVDYENYKIKDIDLKSLEHNRSNEIANKNDKFHNIEHSIFYTYLDYVEVTNFNNEFFRELRHFGKFIN